MCHYKRFLHDGAGLAPVWEDLKQQIYLGSDDFIEQLQDIQAQEKSQHDLDEVPQLQRRTLSKHCIGIEISMATGIQRWH